MYYLFLIVYDMYLVVHAIKKVIDCGENVYAKTSYFFNVY